MELGTFSNGFLKVARVVCLIVLFLGIFGVLRQFDDDYCFSLDRMPRGIPEGSSVDTDWSLLPPGAVCTYDMPEGEVLQLRPGVSSLLVPISAFLLAWLLTVVLRKRRSEQAVGKVALFLIGVSAYPALIAPMYLLDMLAPAFEVLVLGMIAAPIVVLVKRPDLWPLAVGLVVSLLFCVLVLFYVLAHIRFSFI